MKDINKIIISRTDNIGDVVLTLPLAATLKEYFPQAVIAFMGKQYTKPVIECCKYIDDFIDVNDFLAENKNVKNYSSTAIIHVFPVSTIAKKAKQLNIQMRIGTTNRLYHWFTCNKLLRFSRKKSSLHESQLNYYLLKPLTGKQHIPDLAVIKTKVGFTNIKLLPVRLQPLISSYHYNLILHPTSNGSAREWGLENFTTLIRLLDKSKIRIFITGSLKDKEYLQKFLDEVKNDVIDIVGKMNLHEIISFINECDALLANSTGPLHIAAVLNKEAYGIYPPMRPIHPGRWAPIGNKVKVFVLNKFCNDCRKNNTICYCVKQISPLTIAAVLNDAANSKMMN